MRHWLWGLVLLLGVGLAIGASQLVWFRASRAGPLPLAVPVGDQEIAWLHNPTSYETWESFVWGVKRAEMTSHTGLQGLEVDDSGAFPDRTTAIPELVVRRTGFTGNLRIRWYKVTDEASQEAWVHALSARDRPPIAVLGGWSSDRAKELADAMREASWSGSKPLLFIVQATAEEVHRPAENYPVGYVPPQLINLYARSFRFCFTNKQMAEAVTDYVFSDETLRPGPIPQANAPPIPAFAIAWEDDDYSIDLSRQFRNEISRRAERATGPWLGMVLDTVPFSVGRLNRPNAREAAVAEQILQQLPPKGSRTMLVVPTVSAPARRTLRALVQGNPAVGERLVAMTGDGIGVNTFFRDREFAWPVRSIPVPVALFTHADPFAWDESGGTVPPRDYELRPPVAGGVRSSTEDIQHFTRLIRIVAAGLFMDGSKGIAYSPDAVESAMKSLNPPFFDADGNRRSGSGEHVIVLRPMARQTQFPSQLQTDGVLEVYVRSGEKQKWTRIHSQPLTRPGKGQE